MIRWTVALVSLSVTACSKQEDPPPAPPPRPKPAKIEALTLKPLPDKKLEVSFRVLDAQGQAMRTYSIGYKVLGCDSSPSIGDKNYDAAKNQLATFQADLQFCGRPPADHKVTLDLRAGEIRATAEVDAKAAYERSGPRPLAELATELGRLATAPFDETARPFTTPNPTIGLFELVIERIVEMEAAAVPKLQDVWKSDPKPVRSRAAAAAIAALDPALLVKDTIALLDAYDAAFATEPKAWMSPAARTAAAGVYAAERIDRPAAVADVFFRALSSPDADLSGMAATWIKSRLPRDVAIDGLFRYMAAKQAYKQREIDVYVAVIEQFGPEGSATVVKNLAALLAAARKPDKVFWAHKVVGLTALAKVGQPSAAPTITKFKADKTRFVSTKQPLDGLGNPTGPIERTDIAFSTLAKQALAAIAKR
jgi:hypothetical protein